jgi:hypothetical protein
MANPGPNNTQTTMVNERNVPPDGAQLGSSAAALIGIWGATPVAQSSPAANVHTVAAGSVTNVFVNTTFDGSIGSTAYTVGDIVAALKLLGVLKS